MEQLAVDKARELVKLGKLRDPAIVRAEQDAAHKRWIASRERKAKAQAEEFQRRAMEAVRANDPDSEIVLRVVEAMRWAQQQ